MTSLSFDDLITALKLGATAATVVPILALWSLCRRWGTSTLGVFLMLAVPIYVHHLGLAKRFRITERFSASFTSQISDIFNTPHFNTPTNNISVPATVGQFTSVVSDFEAEKANGRRIALMLRVEF